MDIVEIAMTTRGFSTLVDLVAEANLLETLKGNGPFTVFAPTNAAFEALPKETIEALVLDNDALTNVLLYHVVSGEILSSDLVDGDSVMTVQGSDVVVSLDTVAMINDAKIITADIFASNGVIHIIDSVLIPPSIIEDEEVAVQAEEKELSESFCSASHPCNECKGGKGIYIAVVLWHH